MRIRHHLLIMLLICVTGGVASTFGLAQMYRRLDVQQHQVGADSLALSGLERLKDGVDRLLVTADLAIGGGETYLLAGARKQVDQLLALVEALREEALHGVVQRETASLLLARRAVVTTTLTENNPANRFAALETSLTFSRIHPPLKLITTIASIGRHKIANARSAGFNRTPKDFSNVLGESLALGTGDTACFARGSDTGQEECLVGVNIAHPCNNRLIEQKILDGDLPFAAR